MAANRPPTKAERARVAQLHAEGASRNAIAKTLGRSHDLVDKLAAELGLSFDRSHTEAATAARKTDLAARRANLEAAYLDDAQKLREQLWTPTTVFNFGGKDNTFNERDLPQPPHADQLKIMQASKLAADQSLRLAEFDAGTGVADAKSLLLGLAQALNVTAAEHDTEDQAQG